MDGSKFIFPWRIISVLADDRIGPSVANIVSPDRYMLNPKLVKQGWCWWYRKYAPRDTTLERREAEARIAKRGLWVDLQPVLPWEWSRDCVCPVERDVHGLQKI